MSSSNLSAKLAALQQAFGATLPEKVQGLETLLNRYICNATVGHSGSRDALQEAHLLAHGLAGSAGTFGFKLLGEAAHGLEELLVPLLEGSPPDAQSHAEAIQRSLAAIRLASQVQVSTTALEFTSALPRNDDASQQERTIYLIEPDTELANSLAAQLSHFGYRVCVFCKPADVTPGAQRPEPFSIVMDAGFSESPLMGTQPVKEGLHKRYLGIPVIYMSATGDFAARLAAVRAGGVAFFTKPVDLDALISALETLCVQTADNAYRVLIVDDAESTGAFYRQVLIEAGIQAVAIHDPSQVSAPLAEFAPDLILMDVYMPGCSGIELAMVIRQQPNYVGIPIVFLSSETNTNRQLVALRQGGDDFLCKPIDPARLVSVVTSRVARARVLRAHMATDGLTGLLNHRHLKDRLLTEIERSRRQSKPLIFAMLDVDYFKRVNDAWGHAAGDRVLRSLAKLLQQRLRRTDVAGRYGGEEFGVILCDIDTHAAMELLDTIRRDFGALRHGSADAQFSVTFSAGIAEYPARPAIDTLIAAADAALYTAKRNGRDQIACDDPD